MKENEQTILDLFDEQVNNSFKIQDNITTMIQKVPFPTMDFSRPFTFRVDGARHW